MSHAVYRVVAFEIVAPCTLRVKFDDGHEQVIDFRHVLVGDLYGALQNKNLFNRVEIDPEVHTLVWPNGADFDPETLHDWPKYAEELKRMAKQWSGLESKAV